MPLVQRIDPIILPGEKKSVAAYCRVSTDSADWELYDLYADGGSPEQA